MIALWLTTVLAGHAGTVEPPSVTTPAVGYSLGGQNRHDLRAIKRKADAALDALYDDDDPALAAGIAADAAKEARAAAALASAQGHAGEAARLLAASQALATAARETLASTDGETHIAAYLAMSEAARRTAALRIDREEEEEVSALLSLIL